MATQRYISTSFWEDAWIRTIDPLARYLYLYLLTNPLTNIAGVYKITRDRISFDTGIDERSLNPMLEQFRAKNKAHYVDDEWIVIPNWPKHQKWRQRSKIKEGIENILYELPKPLLSKLCAIGYQYPMDTLSITYDKISIPYTYDSNYSDSDTEFDTRTRSDGWEVTDEAAVDNSVDNSGPSSVVLSVVEYLSKETGKPFSPNDRETRALIGALQSGGYSEDDMKHVIAIKKAHWTGKTTSDGKRLEDFLRPATLFKFDNFDRYLLEYNRRKETTPPSSLPFWICASCGHKNTHTGDQCLKCGKFAESA